MVKPGGLLYSGSALTGRGQLCNTSKSPSLRKPLEQSAKAKYKKLQRKLFELWDKYDNGEITTSQLLQATSKISGRPSATSIDNYD